MPYIHPRLDSHIEKNFRLSQLHTLHLTLILLNPSIYRDLFVCLFDLILYVPSTVFQLYRDGSSWVEPVLS